MMSGYKPPSAPFISRANHIGSAFADEYEAMAIQRFLPNLLEEIGAGGMSNQYTIKVLQANDLALADLEKTSNPSHGERQAFQRFPDAAMIVQSLI